MRKNSFVKLLNKNHIHASFCYGEHESTGILLTDSIFWFSKWGFLKSVETRDPIGAGTLSDIDE